MIDYNEDIARDYFKHHEYDNYDLWDFIHEYIDNKVSPYSNKKNIKIIMKQFGSIYKALKSYKDEYGYCPIECDVTEKQFYACLAYHSIKENVDEEEIEKIIRCLKICSTTDNEDSTDEEDSTDDI